MKKLCEAEELSPVSIASGRDQSSGFDAAFALHRIQTDQVEGDMFEHRKVMGCVTSAGTHLIVLEDHIHTPVQAILNRPVSAYRLTDALGIRGYTADVNSPFPRGLVLDRALRIDHHKGFHFRPLLRFVQTVQLSKGIAGT